MTLAKLRRSGLKWPARAFDNFERMLRGHDTPENKGNDNRPLGRVVEVVIWWGKSMA